MPLCGAQAEKVFAMLTAVRYIKKHPEGCFCFLTELIGPSEINTCAYGLLRPSFYALRWASHSAHGGEPQPRRHSWRTCASIFSERFPGIRFLRLEFPSFFPPLLSQHHAMGVEIPIRTLPIIPETLPFVNDFLEENFQVLLVSA